METHQGVFSGIEEALLTNLLISWMNSLLLVSLESQTILFTGRVEIYKTIKTSITPSSTVFTSK